MWMAGGGVKPGHVHGEHRRVRLQRRRRTSLHVHDLHATILRLPRLRPRGSSPSASGRDFRLTDVHGKIVQSLIA
jgi:hypothetical protein